MVLGNEESQTLAQCNEYLADLKMETSLFEESPLRFTKRVLFQELKIRTILDWLLASLVVKGNIPELDFESLGQYLWCMHYWKFNKGRFITGMRHSRSLLTAREKGAFMALADSALKTLNKEISERDIPKKLSPKPKLKSHVKEKSAKPLQTQQAYKRIRVKVHGRGKKMLQIPKYRPIVYHKSRIDPPLVESKKEVELTIVLPDCVSLYLAKPEQKAEDILRAAISVLKAHEEAANSSFSKLFFALLYLELRRVSEKKGDVLQLSFVASEPPKEEDLETFCRIFSVRPATPQEVEGAIRFLASKTRQNFSDRVLAGKTTFNQVEAENLLLAEDRFSCTLGDYVVYSINKFGGAGVFKSKEEFLATVSQALNTEQKNSEVYQRRFEVGKTQTQETRRLVDLYQSIVPHTAGPKVELPGKREEVLTVPNALIKTGLLSSNILGITTRTVYFPEKPENQPAYYKSLLEKVKQLKKGVSENLTGKKFSINAAKAIIRYHLDYTNPQYLPVLADLAEMHKDLTPYPLALSQMKANFADRFVFNNVLERVMSNSRQIEESSAAGSVEHATNQESLKAKQTLAAKHLQGFIELCFEIVETVNKLSSHLSAEDLGKFGDSILRGKRLYNQDYGWLNILTDSLLALYCFCPDKKKVQDAYDSVWQSYYSKLPENKQTSKPIEWSVETANQLSKKMSNSLIRDAAEIFMNCQQDGLPYKSSLEKLSLKVGPAIAWDALLSNSRDNKILRRSVVCQLLHKNSNTQLTFANEIFNKDRLSLETIVKTQFPRSLSKNFTRDLEDMTVILGNIYQANPELYSNNYNEFFAGQIENLKLGNIQDTNLTRKYAEGIMAALISLSTKGDTNFSSAKKFFEAMNGVFKGTTFTKAACHQLVGYLAKNWPKSAVEARTPLFDYIYDGFTKRTLAVEGTQENVFNKDLYRKVGSIVQKLKIPANVETTKVLSLLSTSVETSTVNRAMKTIEGKLPTKIPIDLSNSELLANNMPKVSDKVFEDFLVASLSRPNELTQIKILYSVLVSKSFSRLNLFLAKTSPETLGTLLDAQIPAECPLKIGDSPTLQNLLSAHWIGLTEVLTELALLQCGYFRETDMTTVKVTPDMSELDVRSILAEAKGFHTINFGQALDGVSEHGLQVLRLLIEKNQVAKEYFSKQTSSTFKKLQTIFKLKEPKDKDKSRQEGKRYNPISNKRLLIGEEGTTEKDPFVIQDIASKYSTSKKTTLTKLVSKLMKTPRSQLPQLLVELHAKQVLLPMLPILTINDIRPIHLRDLAADSAALEAVLAEISRLVKGTTFKDNGYDELNLFESFEYRLKFTGDDLEREFDRKLLVSSLLHLGLTLCRVAPSTSSLTVSSFLSLVGEEELGKAAYIHLLSVPNAVTSEGLVSPLSKLPVPGPAALGMNRKPLSQDPMFRYIPVENVVDSPEDAQNQALCDIWTSEEKTQQAVNNFVSKLHEDLKMKIEIPRYRQKVKRAQELTPRFTISQELIRRMAQAHGSGFFTLLNNFVVMIPHFKEDLKHFLDHWYFEIKSTGVVVKNYKPRNVRTAVVTPFYYGIKKRVNEYVIAKLHFKLPEESVEQNEKTIYIEVDPEQKSFLFHTRKCTLFLDGEWRSFDINAKAHSSFFELESMEQVLKLLSKEAEYFDRVLLRSIISAGLNPFDRKNMGSVGVKEKKYFNYNHDIAGTGENVYNQRTIREIALYFKVEETLRQFIEGYRYGNQKTDLLKSPTLPQIPLADWPKFLYPDLAQPDL